VTGLSQPIDETTVRSLDRHRHRSVVGQTPQAPDEFFKACGVMTNAEGHHYLASIFLDAYVVLLCCPIDSDEQTNLLWSITVMTGLGDEALHRAATDWRSWRVPLLSVPELLGEGRGLTVCLGLEGRRVGPVPDLHRDLRKILITIPSQMVDQ
jgi:hypothetical protein